MSTLVPVRSPTPDELRCIGHLVKAWNSTLAIPLTGNQRIEFMQAIHRAQEIIMSQPVTEWLNSISMNWEVGDGKDQEG